MLFVRLFSCLFLDGCGSLKDALRALHADSGPFHIYTWKVCSLPDVFIGSLRASRGILDQLQTLRASRGFLAEPICELKVRFHTLQPDVS